MPNPKRKMSRTRRDKRRAQYNAKTVAATGTTCANCGSFVYQHRACDNCGYYKGMFVPVKSSKEAS